MERMHATAVDIAGKGVLLCGPSGAGKSDLALRLIDRGASFISDDQVELTERRRGIYVSAPKQMRGYMEIRGLGITSLPVLGGTFVFLIVDLVSHDAVPRLPLPAYKTVLGQKIPVIYLNAFEISTPIKIELAADDISRIGATGPNDRISPG